MSAILGVMSIIASFVPLAFLGVAILSPLIAAIAAYYTKDKYLIVFVAGSSLLCLLVTLYSYGETVFGVIPGIISGSLFGLLLKKKIPTPLLIALCSLLEFGLNYVGVWLLRFLSEIDIIETGLQLLGLDGKENICYIVPCFIYVYALAESAISFIVIEGVLERFERDDVSWPLFDKILPFLAMTLLGVAIGLAFIWPALGFVIFALGIYLSLSALFPFVERCSWQLCLLFIAVEFAAGYLFAAFYSNFPKSTGLLLSGIFFASFDLLAGLNSLLLKRKENE